MSNVITSWLLMVMEIILETQSKYAKNYEIWVYCGNQGAKVHPMHIGGARGFPFGRIKLTIAHHGSGFESGNEIVILVIQ